MKTLKFTIEQMVWQEVPGEVSLAFLFSGCPLRCKGCHSADAWKEGVGTELTEDYLRGRLKRYRGHTLCSAMPKSLRSLKLVVGWATTGWTAAIYT